MARRAGRTGSKKPSPKVQRLLRAGKSRLKQLVSRRVATVTASPEPSARKVRQRVALAALERMGLMDKAFVKTDRTSSRRARRR